MHGLLPALKRGFKRWIGWRRLGVAASVIIIAFAITTLVRPSRASIPASS